MNPAFLFEFVTRGRRINAIEDLVRTVKKVIYEFIINYKGLFKKTGFTPGSICYEACMFFKSNI